MKESLRQYCRRMELDWLAEEFDEERNWPLTVDSISYGSSLTVWWQCEHRHHWQASPSSRRNGSRCPYCAGIKPVPGENDLETQYPEIAAAWHPTKNGTLKPGDVLPGSKKLVWWRCEKGHEWTACPKARVSGADCPTCKKESDSTYISRLSDRFPQLAAEWNAKRNGVLTPADVSVDSSKRVWWQCEKGHEWQAQILVRTTTDSPCPICSGRKLVRGVNDLKTANPKLAAQWAAENAPLTASDVAVNSCKRVWWRCKEGHLFRMSVAARSEKKQGCPCCSGKIKPRETVEATIPSQPRRVPYPGERPAV